MEQLPQELRSAQVAGVRVDPVAKTSIVAIAVSSTDPRMAAWLANAIADTYIETSTRQNQDATNRTLKYIGTLLDTAKDELDQAEDELRAYKEATGIVSIESQTARELGRVGQLEDDVASARAKLAATSREIAVVQQQRSTTARTALGKAVRTSNELTDEMRSQLVRLESRRIELLASHTEKSRAVRQVDEQIAVARHGLSEAVRDVIATQPASPSPELPALNERLIGMETERVATEARIAAVTTNLGQARSALANIPGTTVAFEELQRKVTVAETAYLNLLEQQQELRITKESQVANATVETVASEPSSPIAIPVRETLSSAFAIGLFLGIVLALLVERLDDTVRDPKELERLIKAPVLGASAWVNEESRLLLPDRDVASTYAEGYRTLRSNLRFSSVDNPVTVLLVTSPGIGEGKTTIAIDLAAVFAEAGQKTVLVDADLRRPSVHSIFGASNEQGMTNVLVGGLDLDSALVDSGIENLQLLLTGPLPPNPVQLLESERMQALLEELKRRVELVIIDSPPLLVASDSQVLASIADGTLLVLDANSTHRQNVLRARDTLELGRARVIGAVINKIRSRGAGYYYYYYYYSYYSRRYYEEDGTRRRRKSEHV